MKVRLLPFAVAAAIAAPGVAMAEATIYGKLNVSVDMVDHDPAGDANDYDEWELNSYDSRLGVKGEEKISDAISGFYTLEYGINVDDGGNSGVDVFTQRNIFVGLKGGWGAVQLGKFDTPLKSAQGKIDQFGDTPGDIKYAINKGENRSSDLIQYSTPKIADALVATLAIQPGEDKCTDASAEPCDDGIADGFSGSVAFDNGSFYAALAYDSAMTGNNELASDLKAWDNTRAVFGLTMGMFEAGFLYQTGEESEPDDADQLDGMVVSGAIKLGESNKIKAQYGLSTLEDGPTGVETDYTLIAVGYENILSKQTNLYVHYIMQEKEADGVSESDDDNIFQLGVVHKF